MWRRPCSIFLMRSRQEQGRFCFMPECASFTPSCFFFQPEHLFRAGGRAGVIIKRSRPTMKAPKAIFLIRRTSADRTFNNARTRSHTHTQPSGAKRDSRLDHLAALNLVWYFLVVFTLGNNHFITHGGKLPPNQAHARRKQLEIIVHARCTQMKVHARNHLICERV